MNTALSEYLQAIFECSTDAYVVVDHNRQVLLMNPAARLLTGWKEYEHVSCSDLFHCRSIEGEPLSGGLCRGLVSFEHCISQPYVEMLIDNGQGESIPVAASYSLLPRPDGPVHLLIALRDLREKKQLEAQVQKQIELVATMHERERLARDFHDGLAQTLAYLKMKVSVARQALDRNNPVKCHEDLDEMLTELDRAYNDVRYALFELRTPIDQDPCDVIAKFLREFERQTGLQTVFNLVGEQRPALGPSVFVQVFRIIQETLSNVRKHAHAQNVEVSAEVLPERVRFTIQDDGCGFDQVAREKPGHYGLQVMHERSRLVGGELAVESAPGQGTRVTLVVPAGPPAVTAKPGS